MPLRSSASSARMPPFMTVFWILKKAKAMPNMTMAIVRHPIDLGAELAPAVTAVDDAGDALGGRVRHDGAVPAGAVLAVGEDADGEHAEDAADAVHGDGADRVVDLELRSMKNTDSIDEDAGDDADDRRRPRVRRRRTAP